ncbi:MAG: hypothetical protein AAGC55_10875, partial [Myxococcota bacterium]
SSGPASGEPSPDQSDTSDTVGADAPQEARPAGDVSPQAVLSAIGARLASESRHLSKLRLLRSGVIDDLLSGRVSAS